jgi:hypothetical protein
MLGIRIIPFIFAMLVSPSVHAEMTQEADLQVLGRVLSMVEGEPVREIKVLIVYSDTESMAQKDAKTVHEILSGGLQAGRVRMWPERVEINNLDFALSSNQNQSVIFVVQGMQDFFGELKTKDVFAISSDRRCMNNDACAVYVDSGPRIEIIVNKTVAKRAGIVIDETFSHIVKEYH